MAGRRKATRPGINLKNENFVRELVLRQKVFAARVDGKMPRFLPAGQSVRDERQRPLCSIDRKNRNALVPAVGGVKEFSVAMHGDFRRIIPSRESLRQRGNLLQATMVF